MSKNSGNGGSEGRRGLTVRVKTARRRTTSSARWLQRQLNDPYVAKAKFEGYRSRAAFKLIELDDKFHFLKPGLRVLDLGAAPGGWTQVAAKRTGAENGTSPPVLGIDLKEISTLPGAIFMVMDFMENDAPDKIRAALGGDVDLVISDMAPNSMGHAATDHMRIMAMCETAYLFATEILNTGGVFLCKVLRGGTENKLLAQIKKDFTSVHHAKPDASRKDSSEAYVVALGFKGRNNLSTQGDL